MNEENTAVATRAPRKELSEWLKSDAVKSQIALALPRHITPDKVVSVALTAINLQPLLMRCTRDSIYTVILRASQFGVELDGRRAHIIPYKQKDGSYIAQFQWDYKGLVDVVMRSGEVSSICADVVCDADEFEFSRGDGGKCFHRPNLRAANRGPVYCAYSYVRLKDGTSSYDIMTIAEIEGIMNRSQGYIAFKNGYIKSCPWVTDLNEMRKKTVFKRHSKWLPFSAELQEKIHADDDIETDNGRLAQAKPVTGMDNPVEEFSQRQIEGEKVTLESMGAQQAPEPVTIQHADSDEQELAAMGIAPIQTQASPPAEPKRGPGRPRKQEAVATPAAPPPPPRIQDIVAAKLSEAGITPKEFIDFLAGEGDIAPEDVATADIQFVVSPVLLKYYKATVWPVVAASILEKRAPKTEEAK